MVQVILSYKVYPMWGKMKIGDAILRMVANPGLKMMWDSEFANDLYIYYDATDVMFYNNSGGIWDIDKAIAEGEIDLYGDYNGCL